MRAKSNIINKNVGTSQTECFGYDISPTAIAHARKIFPLYNFEEFDLINDKINGFFKGRTLFTIRGVLWYLFSEIEKTITNLKETIKKDNYLLICQPFTHGNFKVIPDENMLFDYLKDSFDVIEYYKMPIFQNGFWLFSLFKRK